MCSGSGVRGATGEKKYQVLMQHLEQRVSMLSEGERWDIARCLRQ